MVSAASENSSDAPEREPPSVLHAYIAAGLSIHPLRLDGSKAPALPRWNQYRTGFATDHELARWRRQPVGIGLVCGVQSGGLEVLDFDEQPDETFSAWLDLLPPAVRGRLCVVETGGFGYHVIYRCTEVCGNCKIAMTEPRGEKQERGVLIESRGEGGYVVAVGSPLSVHSSGRAYVQVMGLPLPAVPEFSPEQRKALWLSAATFDTRQDVREEYVRRRVSELRPATDADTTTPWGDFDVRANWDDILGPHGWHSSDGIHWTRPGKTSGVSAKVVAAKDGTEVLTVFSTAAGALSSGAGGEKSWGKYRAFAKLFHANDWSAAARAAKAKGYGGTHQ